MNRLTNVYHDTDISSVELRSASNESIFLVEFDTEGRRMKVSANVPDVSAGVPVIISSVPYIPVTNKCGDDAITGYQLRNGYELIIGDICHINMVSNRAGCDSRTTITVHHKTLGKYTQTYHKFDENKDVAKFPVQYNGRILEYDSYIDIARCMNDIALILDGYFDVSINTIK